MLLNQCCVFKKRGPRCLIDFDNRLLILNVIFNPETVLSKLNISGYVYLFLNMGLGWRMNGK